MRPDPETAQLLREDVTRRLAERGALGRTDLGAIVEVTEGPIFADQEALPGEWITGFRKEVAALGEPLLHREIVGGAVAAARTRLERGLASIRGALVDEALRHIELEDAVRRAYREQAGVVSAALRGGGLAEFSGNDPADLAAVAARRASHAARAAAGAWEGIPAGAELLAGRPDLWVHGIDTVETGRRAIEAWADGLSAEIRTASRRRWMRRKTVTSLAAALRRAAVDFRHRPDPAVLRKLPGFEACRRRARDDLDVVLSGVLDHDAARFDEVRGVAPGGEALSRLWIGGDEDA
jgi:hypothetical protein